MSFQSQFSAQSFANFTLKMYEQLRKRCIKNFATFAVKFAQYKEIQNKNIKYDNIKSRR